MNSLDRQYQNLLKEILEYGKVKGDRTGVGTRSIFGYTIRHNMSDGFPLLTTKKMYFKGIVTELLWFLQGDTNIRYLVDNDCHIWDGDAYKNYIKETDVWSDRGPHNITLDELNMIGKITGPISNSKIRQYTQEEFINKIKTDDEFAAKWGDLGPIYGKQWRSWGSEDILVPMTKENFLGSHTYNVPFEIKEGIDQIANVIQDLKKNPDSRRLIVNAWNVSEIDQMVLPPCHSFFQFYTRELTLKERAEAYNNMLEKQNYNPKWQSKIKDIDNLSDGELMTILQSLSGPTRAISLLWYQRSVDTFLGLPFNIASYGLLLEIVAKTVNMVPEQLIGTLGDVHIYLNHEDAVREQINRDSFDLPQLEHMKTSKFYEDLSSDLSLFGHLDITDFQIKNYESHKTIKAQLNN